MTSLRTHRPWIRLVTFLLCTILLQPTLLQGANQVSKHGFTWTFDKDYTVGQYANGDWYVVDPGTGVTISSVSPAPSNGLHGTVVNPPAGKPQGWDSRMFDYTSSMSASFPLKVTSSSNPASVVSMRSTVSGDTHVVDGYSGMLDVQGRFVRFSNRHSYEHSAAVLTVVATAPPAQSFRPSYCGTAKVTGLTASDINWPLLSSKSLGISSPPAISDIAKLENWFREVWVDVYPNDAGRGFHPTQNMPNFGREIGRATGETASLLLLGNYAQAQKENLLTYYLQLGIDLYGVIINGGQYPAAGGHGSGRKLPILFAGYLLGHTGMQNNTGYFDEDHHTYWGVMWEDGKTKIGRWGKSQSGINPDWYDVVSESGDKYWKKIVTGPKDWKHPEGKYDAHGYSTVTPPSWVGTALASRLLGADGKFKDHWYAYIDRKYHGGGRGSLGFSSQWLSDLWEQQKIGSSDTIAPLAPGNLQITNATDSTVSLAWTAAPAASDGDLAIAYRIYRDGTLIGQVSQLAYQDTQLTETTPYAYTVYSIDDAGNQSASAASITGSTLADTLAPSINSVWAEKNSVTLVFNEPLQSAAATNISHYSISNNISISSALLSADSSSITLTTSTHTESVNYTITASNIQDLAGNVMASSPTSYQYENSIVSSSSWTNQPTASQTANYNVEFDATPLANSIDGVIGFSNNTAANYSDLAIIARFNPSGKIDARNGSSYSAQTDVAYVSGVIYHFRMEVNLVTHSYNIYVTPSGSSELTIGMDYAFRTEQNAVTQINNLALAPGGPHKLSNIQFSQSSPLPNNPPVLSSIGNQTITESNLLSFTVTVTDPDNDPITCVATNLPDGATFTNQTFRWIPNAAQIGIHSVTITASDSQTQDSETFSITVSSAPTQDPPVSTESLVLEMNLDNNPGDGVIDTSTYKSNGIAHGNVALATDRYDNTAQAYDFDGSGDFVEIPHSASFDIDTVSVAAWVNHRDAGDDRIVSKSSGTTVADHIFSLGVVGAGSDQSIVRVRLSSDLASNSFDSTVSFPINTWTHIGFTYDEQTVKIYIDGKESGTFSMTGAIVKSNVPIVIGNLNTYDDRYYNGLIDTVKIYNSPLSASEMAALAVTIVPPTNEFPILKSIGAKSTFENVALTFGVNASDPDGDTLTYTVQNLPTGASFIKQGFSWTPTSDQIGDHSITFVASDGQADDSETITITVNPTPQPTGNQILELNLNTTPTDGVPDSSGYNNNGVAYGNITLGANRNGQAAQAYNFDGSGDFVSIPHSTDFDLDHITVAAWVNQQQIGDNRVVCKSSSTTIADHIFSLGVNSAGGDQGLVRVRLSTSSESASYDSTTTFTANRWTHVGFTYDGQFVRCYINGIESGVFAHSGAINKQAIPIVIGNVNLTDNRYFDGAIDDVKIYNTALSTSEIASLAYSETPTNNPPIMQTIGDKSIGENSSLSFNISATDADDDTVTFSADNLPIGASFNGSTFSWTPTYDQAGSYYITFIATDGIDLDSKTITVTVSESNQAPILEAIENVAITENNPVTFTVTASDPDGDSLTYSIEGIELLEGATFENQTFNWIPNFNSAGNYQVNVVVSDGIESSSRKVAIAVLNNNRPPLFAPIPNYMVKVGDTLTFEISASDLDNDPITYSALSYPGEDASLTPTANGAVFSWKPEGHELGTHSITFIATDGQEMASASITIEVVEGNVKPLFVPINPQTTQENSEITFAVSATDENDDPLSYSVENLPAGAIFTNQTLTWTPDFDAAGEYNITFIVSDGLLQDFMTTSLIVYNTNRSPQIQTLSDFFVNDNEIIQLDLPATDPDGDELTLSVVSGLPNNATLTGTHFNWPLEYGDSGTYLLTFVASDGDLEASATTTITIDHINVAPVIDAPIDQFTNQFTTMSFPILATDLEGDPIEITVQNLPTGATYTNGLLNWTPTTGQDGTSQITIQASDGQLTSTATVNLYVMSINQDTVSPFVGHTSPTDESIQVPLNTLLVMEVSDSDSGVDANSVVIQMDGQDIYRGNSNEYSSVHGTTYRYGNSAIYKYSFQPTKMFTSDQHVSLSINAKDLTGNAMTTHSFSFSTEMMVFGGIESISLTDDGKDQSNPDTTKDASGNLWATLQDGTNIIVTQRGADDNMFSTTYQIPASGEQANPTIATDSSGKVYLAWQEIRDGFWNIITSTSTDGLNWSTPTPVATTQENQTNPVIVANPLVPGEVYVAFEQDSNIHLAISLNALTSVTLKTITAQPSLQSNPDMVFANANAYLVWTDGRNATTAIYGAASNNNWANIPIVNSSSNQSEPSLAAQTGSDTLHLAWTDDQPGNRDIYYSNLNGFNNTPVTGINIIDDTTNRDQFNASITTTGSGDDLRVFVGWQDNRNSPSDSDIYAVDITTSSGTNILVTTNTAKTNQTNPVLNVNSLGDPYLLWVDDSSTHDEIYYGGAMNISGIQMAATHVKIQDGGTVGTTFANITSSEDVGTEVPAGSLWSDATVTITKVNNPIQSSDIASILSAHEFGPSSELEFTKPVTITIPYEIADNQTAEVYWYNSITGEFSQSGLSDVETIEIGPNLRAVRFKTTHFSKYLIGEKKAKTRGKGSRSK